jgi:hypothetical protein
MSQMRVVRSNRTGFARVLRALLVGVSALLIGCHRSDLIAPGTPVVTMGQSDNTSDFASYIVTVDSITLTDNNGNVVTLLGTPETVDLARLSDLGEFVEAPAVPSATYVSASIVLDYSEAALWPNVNGGPIVGSALNPDGTAATVDTITVTFDPDHPLVIPDGSSTRVHIDIDLAASNAVNPATSPATVTIQPFVVITPAPVDATPLRVRGLFVTTQSIASGFYINTRPFYDLVSALGAVIVNTNAQTYFNVNDVTLTGAAGLAAIAQLQESTPIVAYGTLDNLSGITPTFNATAVYAGTSQESPLAEYLTGVVSARSGSTINVRGATYFIPAAFPYPPLINSIAVEMNYYASVPVTLGESTIVSEDGVAVPGLSAASVSVGQQITVSGQASVDSSTSDNPVSIDATAGQVRLQPSTLWGTLNSASTNSASLDVLSLGNVAAAGFNFAGTGTAGHDATPGAYQVNTGALNESAVAAGTLLQVDGIVSPFGTAPPDFNATAITPGSSTLQQLVVEWANGATAAAPFSSFSGAGLVVDLASAGSSIHYIRTGPAMLDLTTLPASPLITTVGADQSNLWLAVGSSALTTGISVFNSATGFATGLKSALNGTNRVFRLVAYGQYNISTNTFVAARIYVALYETT